MRQKTRASLLTMAAALLVGALYSSVAISRPAGPGLRTEIAAMTAVGFAARRPTTRE